MGRKAGVGGRVGRGRGAGAVGRASERVLRSSNPLRLATSLEFLRLCLSVGIVKLCVKPLLQFSNFSFDRVPLMKPDVLSVRGELWKASHRKEEEGRSGGRLVSKDLVLSRLKGLMDFAPKNQIIRITNVILNQNGPPCSKGMTNRIKVRVRIQVPFQPKDEKK